MESVRPKESLRRKAFDARFSFAAPPVVNFYEVICDICKKSESEKTVDRLVQTTLGWHIGAEVGDSDYCPLCA